MNIYYIDIEKFKKTHKKDILAEYADKELSNEKRYYEYTIGRYLIKNAAKEFYNTDNNIIINENGKPVFENSELNFSLSHSKDYVVACFDKNLCGIDIEFIKERNFEKLGQYYGEKFNTQDEFYKFWTLKEASYKLGSTAADSYTVKFMQNYYLTIVSNKSFNKKIKIIQFE